MRAGDWRRAILIASRFPVCECKAEVRRAASVYLSPRFYAQLGKENEAIIETAKAALLVHYPVETTEDRIVREIFANGGPQRPVPARLDIDKNGNPTWCGKRLDGYRKPEPDPCLEAEQRRLIRTWRKS